MSDKKIKYVSCIVHNCHAKSADNPNKKFYKFPNNVTRKNDSITSLGLQTEYLKNKYNHVCEDHFLKEQIGSYYLTRNAIPVLNIVKQHDKRINSFAISETSIDPRVAPTLLNHGNNMIVNSSTQTDPIDEEIEFLELINKINCFSCDATIKSDISCYKCVKYVKKLEKYQKHSKILSKKYKLLQVKYARLHRNFYNVKKKKNSKEITIEKTIDDLKVNNNTKSVCKLLLKKDFYYNESDKNIAQCIFYKSSSVYKYLLNSLNLKLPSVSSIYKWAPIKFVPPGTNFILMKQLERVFLNMPTNSKICILSFDEIKIKKDLTMNLSTNKIDGFCDDGVKRTKELATSALFFMLRGVIDNWKHVLNYVLINNLDAASLSELIINNIKTCQEILKLNVVMLTCDQAAINIQTYKFLGIEANKPYTIVNDSKIFAQFDSPHLLKSARNAFLQNKIMHFEFGTADSAVISKIFELDTKNRVKLLPKITKIHMQPSNFQKMSVKLAAQLLSNTVASSIRTVLQVSPEFFGQQLDNVLPTAKLVEFFNNLFDCLNSRNFSSTAPYGQPLYKDNKVYHFLENSLENLKNIKIISRHKNYFKFIKGFQLTIESQLGLINYLAENYNVEFILTGRTNQDALENFFSQLRGKGGFNYMPTSFDIGHHFANILVTKILSNSTHSNCILDDSESIKFDWDMFKTDYRLNIQEIGGEHDDCDEEMDILVENLNTENIENNAITYYAGYCLRKKIKCDLCQLKLFKGDEEFRNNETFIYEKNFNKEASSFGSLKVPSDEFFSVAKLVLKIFESYYAAEGHLSNFREKIAITSFRNILQCYPTFLPKNNDPCYKHIEDLINFYILVLIRKNCKWSVLNDEFCSKKSKPQNNYHSTPASKKLKILNN